MCTSFKKNRPLSIPRTILPSLALRLKFQIHTPISSSSEKSRPVLDGRRGSSMESMVPALRSSAVGGGTHAPNFHPREGLGGPRMKGNPPMAAATCPAFARQSRSTIFPPSASVVPFCRRGLAFLDDSNGASILARGITGGVSFSICLLQTPRARTWEVHPPWGTTLYLSLHHGAVSLAKSSPYR